MLRRASPLLSKKPVYVKYDDSEFTHQFKRILNRKHVHYYKWDEEPLLVFPADRLAHADVRLDQRTGKEVFDASRHVNAYKVPDQKFHYFRVPEEYKDAYWIREREARRVQCPVEWVEDRYKQPWKYDITDDSLKEKFTFTEEQVIAHAKRERR